MKTQLPGCFCNPSLLRPVWLSRQANLLPNCSMGLGIQSEVPLHKVGGKRIKIKSVKKINKWKSLARLRVQRCSSTGGGLAQAEGLALPMACVALASPKTLLLPRSSSAPNKGRSFFLKRGMVISYQCSGQSACLIDYIHPFAKYSEYQLCAQNRTGSWGIQLISCRRKQKMSK